jgi:hypothetical protein
MAARWDAGGAGQGEERKIKVLYLIPYRGIRDTSRQISFEFLFIKTRPTDNGFGFVIQFRVGIRYVIRMGANFEKKDQTKFGNPPPGLYGRY